MIRPIRKSKQFFDKKDIEKNEEPGRITKKKKREQHENNAPETERRRVRKTKTKK